MDLTLLTIRSVCKGSPQEQYLQTFGDFFGLELVEAVFGVLFHLGWDDPMDLGVSYFAQNKRHSSYQMCRAGLDIPSLVIIDQEPISIVVEFTTDFKWYFESMEMAANVDPGCMWSSSELLFLISKLSVLIIVEIDNSQLDCLRRQGTGASSYDLERGSWVRRSTCTNMYKSSSDLLPSRRIVLVNLGLGLCCSRSCISSSCCSCWVLGGCLISLYVENLSLVIKCW